MCLGKIYHGSSGDGVDPEHWTEWVNVKIVSYADPQSLKSMRVSRTSALGGRQRKRGPTTESAEVPNVTYADKKPGQRRETILYRGGFYQATSTICCSKEILGFIQA